MAKLNEKIDSQNEEISSLYKVIADLKTTVETLSGTIIHLQEQTKLIQQKITKQPTIIHDK
jgi:septal ring factor EnvC (AmiA/AmiB activator)